MIDCHLHLQDPRLSSDLEGIMETARALGIRRLVVNGTGPHDWEAVERLAKTYPEVTPSFGLHPWKVGTETDGWLEDLEGRLLRHPDAGVGEIGLDRWIHGHDLESQREIFIAQLELAERLGRPLSIHCLRAWGSLCEILTEHRPGSGVLLHSYGGPAEMVERFVEIGAYFSISGYFFLRDKTEKLANFDRVPRERILIETDAPDMVPPPEWRRYEVSGDPSRTLNHPGNLVAIHEATAAHFALSLESLGDLVARNFANWWHCP